MKFLFERESQESKRRKLYKETILKYKIIKNSVSKKSDY
jgi:hypothetical protein